MPQFDPNNDLNDWEPSQTFILKVCCYQRARTQFVQLIIKSKIHVKRRLKKIQFNQKRYDLRCCHVGVKGLLSSPLTPTFPVVKCYHWPPYSSAPVQKTKSVIQDQSRVAYLVMHLLTSVFTWKCTTCFRFCFGISWQWLKVSVRITIGSFHALLQLCRELVQRKRK